MGNGGNWSSLITQLLFEEVLDESMNTKVPRDTSLLQ